MSLSHLNVYSNEEERVVDISQKVKQHILQLEPKSHCISDEDPDLTHNTLLLLDSSLCSDCQSTAAEEERESLSAESSSMQPGTMCWIGSLYISLPFGHSNATLPYEGSSTRSTCSKQNAIGDQLQRPPSSSDCFSDRHSRLQEEGERRGSINCYAWVQTIIQPAGDSGLS